MNAHRALTGVVCLLILLASQSARAQEKLIRVGDDDRVLDQYVVVLSDESPARGVADVIRDLAAGEDIRVGRVWEHAFKGFSATMNEARAIALSRNPRVKFVEENARWHLSASQRTFIDPATCDPTAIGANCPAVTDNRLWHLDRLDQNGIQPSNNYSYCSTGAGVHVYVVDTGVMAAHQEFSGVTIHEGKDTSGDSPMFPATDPCQGFPTIPSTPDEDARLFEEIFLASHGTAVASAVAGRRVGVAKGVTIVPIKTSRCETYSARVRRSDHPYAVGETMFVVGGPGVIATYRAIEITGSGKTAPVQASDGSWPYYSPNASAVWDGGIRWIPVDPSNQQTSTTVIDGLDWILSNSDNTLPKTGAIVTMSTFRRATSAATVDRISALELAVDHLLAAGMVVIASANNQNGDACDTTPARMSQNTTSNRVITVGGSMPSNVPWTATISSGEQAANGGAASAAEPPHDATRPMTERRWICGAGDSLPCLLPIGATAYSKTATERTGYGTYYDRFSGGSNGGMCVTLFSPAKNLSLAGFASANHYRDPRLAGTLASGTSWSAPIVAGLSARIWQSNPGWTAQQVRQRLLNSTVPMDLTDFQTYDWQGNPISIPYPPQGQ